jgi:hypothetical protein
MLAVNFDFEFGRRILNIGWGLVFRLDIDVKKTGPAIDNSFRNGPDISERSSHVLQPKTKLLPRMKDTVQKKTEISFTSIFIAEECLQQFIYFNVKMSIKVSLLMLKNVSLIQAESQQQFPTLNKKKVIESFFWVYGSVHRISTCINISKEMQLYLGFYFKNSIKNSTYFGRSPCPSSGVTLLHRQPLV